MRRIIFNALTMLSLLLCLAMAGLCVRSYWAAGYLGVHFYTFHSTDVTAVEYYTMWGKGNLTLSRLRDTHPRNPSFAYPKFDYGRVDSKGYNVSSLASGNPSHGITIDHASTQR